jgi:rRNA-processing protein FCF1
MNNEFDVENILKMGGEMGAEMARKDTKNFDNGTSGRERGECLGGYLLRDQKVNVTSRDKRMNNDVLKA